ncbi:MAG: carbamoyl-phosphate synthase large subunit [Phycisphaerales bacterium]|nr:carbamoyl-phosphate synthase large subunit [Planctomycetota bacterium]MCH8508797.1 carbamoyl-phosphate synthase large subunit [Phycisphaerales bacterium]
MPKRDDIRTILLIGSGPIVIGQGCEFDYSGTQACKSLRDEGFRVVLVNSNPATIMTDPAFADRTYVEPITPETVRKIIEKEKEMGTPIDAVLPTLGGQTALNCACELWDQGVFQEHGIEMIGADRAVIHRAEDRKAFAEVCARAGLATPKSQTVQTLKEADEFLEEIGLPAIIRPAFTLGGWGGGIAYNRAEFEELVTRGLRASMIGQVQVDKSLIGWKEYELEVVRDKKDNCVIVCGIENIDAMGVHTGDSITVAPILTLTDKEYQALRDAAIKIMREVGVETGGSNVQFAVNPDPEPREDGTKPFELVVVEMNPRVSRSSALASKATGFPIAKIAAKLAVGYTLDELRNDITGTTSACFEPSIDYVVTKMPRWTFEKFPEADETLTTQMKSVGEAMAIGRTFKESFQKVVRSMEVKRFGFGLDRNDLWLQHQRSDDDRTPDGQPIEWPVSEDKLTRKLSVPSQGRMYYIRYALKMGWSVERVCSLTRIDKFFIAQLAELVAFEDELMAVPSLDDLDAGLLLRAKRMGYSDVQLANVFLGEQSAAAILKVRAKRKALGVEAVFKVVDTCAAEFEAVTPYYYSTYQPGHRRLNDDGTMTTIPAEDELVLRLDRDAGGGQFVVILGGGPNRIGQGIEFDYCCVHAALTARELGFRSVMINSNPETVSTDYDTSDLLFFEPLTLEDVLNVVEKLNASPRSLPGGLTAAAGVEVSPSERSEILASLKAAGYDRGEVLFRMTGASDDETWIVGVTDGKVLTIPTDGSGGATYDRELVGHLARHTSQVKAWADRGPVRGLVVQFGGQTPLNLAHGLDLAGAPLLGTPLDAIDRAEDRDRFDQMLTKLDLKRPGSGIARSVDEAVEIADRIGYPVLVRPSYVLGGRGMEICPDENALRHYMATAVDVSGLDDAPVLIDQFLDAATELDIDVVADFGNAADPRALVCAVMEHIEQAGVHSGDSTCMIPYETLRASTVQEVRVTARRLAAELGVCGLMNVQMAVKDDEVYIIEVNPRASRTVPFVGKAKGVAWASVAARAMLGVSLAEQGSVELPDVGYCAFKAPVFPFQKFPGVDFVLGPEMRSTGEVMGVDVSRPVAFMKALLGAGTRLPTEGGVFLSVRQEDKESMVSVARSLMAMGFEVWTTGGTAELMQRHGLRPKIIQKIQAGARPNVIDLMQNGDIQLVINTPTKTGWQTDEGRIRATAVRLGIPMITTATAAHQVVHAIAALRAGDWGVSALQDLGALAKSGV